MLRLRCTDDGGRPFSATATPAPPVRAARLGRPRQRRPDRRSGDRIQGISYRASCRTRLLARTGLVPTPHQATPRRRAPRHHGDALVRAEPKHFAFLFAVQQVDVILARDLECRRTCNRYTAAIHQGRSCRISRNPRSQSSSPALSLSSRFARRAPDAVSSRPAASPIPPPRTISHGPRIRPMNIGE
jgi:hypothetical protein